MHEMMKKNNEKNYKYTKIIKKTVIKQLTPKQNIFVNLFFKKIKNKRGCRK